MDVVDVNNSAGATNQTEDKLAFRSSLLRLIEIYLNQTAVKTIESKCAKFVLFCLSRAWVETKSE